MKRLIPLLAALALIALPATALGASTHGLVFSVNHRQHKVQLIDSRFVVHAYRYTGVLPALHAGSRIRFRPAGASIARVKLAGAPARVIRFRGTVVRSSARSLVLRLGDNVNMTLAAQSASPVRPAVINPRRLAPARPQAFADTAPVSFTPGHQVLVTESLSARGQAAKIAVKPTTGSDSSGTTGGGTTGGGSGSTGGGSGSTGGGSGSTGGSGAPSCTPATGSDDVIGNITSVSTIGITISGTSQGTMTFVLDDPTITDGMIVGDQVDVTYSQQSDCSLVASDVEYNELDALGTVLAVSSSSMTILDQSTGATDTFTADPAEQMFDGESVGDQVDVTYHLSGGQTVVDAVN